MTTAAFDPFAWHAHYHGTVSREDAENLLNESGIDFGTFLIRDSTSQTGDYVLSVKERERVSHYLIHSTEADDGSRRWTIGEQTFVDIPELLNFFKMHYLNTSPLTRPAPRKALCKVTACFEFDGQQPTDLPFRKGELLYIIGKPEDMWWTARNEVGRTGQIPVNFVRTLEENGNCSEAGSSGSQRNSAQSSEEGVLSNRNSGSPLAANDVTSEMTSTHGIRHKTTSHRKLPALARVIQNRLPNAYDKTALRLKVGDIISVTKCDPNGQWTGTLQSNQKTGVFPFNYVEWIQAADS